MTKQCCVCKKVKSGDAWTSVANPEWVAAHATHGYCPACAVEAYAELEQLAAEREILRAGAMHEDLSRTFSPFA